MKILTVVGTRPELIRLSVIIKKLDTLTEHVFVYTNQNADYSLSGQFINDLKIPQPDYRFNISNYPFANFFSNAIVAFDKILEKENPDKILILGDTNSGLLSIIAKKRKIPIYHMEAGNRCYDDRVPEEANRKIIDSVSTYNLPYTKNSKENLLQEGYHKNYTFCIGNPIYEVLNAYKDNINNSKINDNGITDYVLVTVHRAENVDCQKTLENIIGAVTEISKKHHVFFSLHPRTNNNLKKIKLEIPKKNITICNGFNFFDFVNLEKHASCVISDSGTVPEECCIFNVPVLTIRDFIERQETIECGSNILVGTKKEDILEAFNVVLNRKYTWVPPEEYLKPNVSDTVINILTGKI